MWKLTKQYWKDVWTLLWSKTTVDDIILAKAAKIKAKAKPILAIFDPMAFPIARVELFSIAAIMLTTSSGRDVPNATTVRPITKVDIPNLFAALTPPLTIFSAPK